LSGLGEAIASLASTQSGESKARLLSALSVMHDGMISAGTKRFDASDTAPGVMSSITSLFFKINGLRWWTDQLRTGFALARSHSLAMQSHMGWGGLEPDMQRVFGLYGIDADKWDIIRMSPDNVDGKSYLTPEGVEALPAQHFEKYLKDRDIPVTDVNIRNLRQEISGQFRTYFYDRSITAIIEPDAKTRGYLYGSTRPGTFEGELLRHLMLFKSFTTSVIQKPLAREIYGRGAMSIKEAMKNGNGEMLGLANLIVWNTAFGYLAMTTKDMLKGKTPRDPEDPKTYLAAMTQGGGFGIMGDFLFGDLKNRYGGGMWSALLGPTAGTAQSIVDIFQRARDGDPIAGQVLRTLTNNTPFINLFYTKAASDYLVLYQMSEHLSPGYVRRMEERAKKEMGQSFIYPPSQYASGL
jgi:hypothetical protein